MEEYRDLDITAAAFTRALDEEEFKGRMFFWPLKTKL
jgi:hypothetical protein